MEYVFVDNIETNRKSILRTLAFCG